MVASRNPRSRTVDLSLIRCLSPDPASLPDMTRSRRQKLALLSQTADVRSHLLSLCCRNINLKFTYPYIFITRLKVERIATEQHSGKVFTPSSCIAGSNSDKVLQVLSREKHWNQSSFSSCNNTQ